MLGRLSASLAAFAVASAALPLFAQGIVVTGSTGGSSAKAYLGQVANDSQVPVNFASATTGTQLQSRSPHFARDTLTSLQIAIPNWYARAGANEAGTGATATVTASIEYPAGTCTPLRFSGAASGSIPNGQTLLSDPVALPAAIPNGARFWTRIHFVSAGGIPYNSRQTGNVAGAMRFGASVPDQTVSCDTVTASGADLSFTPVAIVAMTTRPSFLAFGDSRVFGLQDTGDASLDYGEVARGLGSRYGVINSGVPGDSMTFIGNAGRTQRNALAAYVSHVVSEYGINDITATTSQMQTGYQTLYSGLLAVNSGARIYQATLPPSTTSTDNWATTANQTVSANEAKRTTINDLIRAGLPQTSGFVELADPLETYRNSGIWKVTGQPYGLTADGIHESQAGNLQLRPALAAMPADR